MHPSKLKFKLSKSKNKNYTIFLALKYIFGKSYAIFLALKYIFGKSYAIFLALKYIFGKKEKWISISALLASIGITLGVSTLIIVLAVMQGFRNTMLDNLLSIQGHINLMKKPTNDQTWGIKNYDQISNKLLENKAITQALPILEQQFMATRTIISSSNISKNNINFGILTHSLPKKQLNKLLSTIIEKTIPKEYKNKANLIYIGKELAKDYQIQIGDTLTLTSSQFIETPFGNAPISQTFTVAGICNFPFFQYNKMLCLLDLADTHNFLNIDDVVSNILIFINNPYSIDEKILNDLKKQFPFAQISTWEETNITFAQVLNTQRNIMFIVISLMIIIASFNGISSLMMLVKEKSKEIAILKVLGSSNKNILLIFLFAGLIISLTSIFLGILLGLLGAYNIDYIRQFIEYQFSINLFPEDFYHLSQIPIYITNQQILLISLWCLLISILSIVYPCWKAMKVEPDKELRI